MVKNNTASTTEQMQTRAQRQLTGKLHQQKYKTMLFKTLQG